jgi:hypothetical protein
MSSTTTCNADAALDARAAERLGISVTDLQCLNVVERGGGVTAGRLATESGLATIAEFLDQAGELAVRHSERIRG